MKYFLYILYFHKADRYYIGSSNNLDRRLSQHKKGYNYSTKRLGDFKLVFSQEFPNLKIARAMESKLKSWKRRDYVERIIADGTIRFTPNKHP